MNDKFYTYPDLLLHGSGVNFMRSVKEKLNGTQVSIKAETRSLYDTNQFQVSILVADLGLYVILQHTIPS